MAFGKGFVALGATLIGVLPWISQVSAQVGAGTFQSPSAVVRPKFRYWVPDGSVDPDLVAKDIQSIGSLGAGGIQFLNYYMYGGSPAGTDWDVYGFGLPPYNNVLKSAAQTCKDSNLIMDYELGVQSGQGAPAEIDNPGLSYDMDPYNVTVAPGASFQGTIPGYGSGGTLISVTTAAIIDQTHNSDHTTYVVAADSITDITNTTTSKGTISVSFPANSTVNEYVIYVVYYKLSLVRSCPAGPNPQNFIQNGSFAVDHYSARGAKVTTDFLEQYVLINGTKELFSEVGGYIWEDSVEIQSGGYWTPDLQANFTKMHGYDIGKYMMLLSANQGLQFARNYPIWYETDAPDKGVGYQSDFRATLSAGYAEYSQHFVDWSNNYLGRKFSAQVGYNLPVDMAQVIPVVDVPEDESLAFNDIIDGYRQYQGAVNLANKQIISNEMGADPDEVYQQGIPRLLTETKRAYCVGTNQMIFHGATYSWQYPKTTWPGFTSFSYSYSEQHSRHQPGWENGYSDALEFVARNNFILQSGTPKRDVAFWNKATGHNSSFVSIYTSTDLINAGYGYEYISPENFKLPQAVVSDGVLAADGPAYKAFVLRGIDVLTLDGATTLAQFANQGLPVIILGGIPTQIASASGLAEAQAIIKNMTSLANVHQIPDGPIAPTLASIGIKPLTQVSANDTWYTYWREDTDAKASYVFVYNDGNYSEGSIVFASTKTPFFFDAWTGEQKPILEYTVSSGYTTIPFKLAAAESRLIAFLTTTPVAAPTTHVTSAPPSVLGLTYSDSTGLIAKVTASTSSSSISTSDGKNTSLPAQNIPSAFPLTNWTLTAERWGPPANLSDVDTIAVKTNSSHSLPTLQTWTSISGLETTSGVGYYNATFLWTSNSTGAIIDFGRVVHTLRVNINGYPLPALDYTDARADISQFLVNGTNVVEAVAATTMLNGLIPIWGQLMTSGGGAGKAPSPVEEVGLVGTVIVTPYNTVKIGG